MSVCARVHARPRAHLQPCRERHCLLLAVLQAAVQQRHLAPQPQDLIRLVLDLQPRRKPRKEGGRKQTKINPQRYGVARRVALVPEGN
jgi:hypothetical protein